MTTPNSTRHIDPSVLAELRELDDGAGEVLKQLIEMFVDGTPEVLLTLADAIKARDAVTLEQEAHKLKSSAANLGAHVMRDLCKDLEHMGRAGNLATAGATLDKVRTEYAAVIAEL